MVLCRGFKVSSTPTIESLHPKNTKNQYVLLNSSRKKVTLARSRICNLCSTLSERTTLKAIPALITPLLLQKWKSVPLSVRLFSILHLPGALAQPWGLHKDLQRSISRGYPWWTINKSISLPKARLSSQIISLTWSRLGVLNSKSMLRQYRGRSRNFCQSVLSF